MLLSDVLGNTLSTNSAIIYLDHSNPVISGVENTVTDWTNVTPTIRISATDYLSASSYNGSGLRSLIIRDDAGNVVVSGVISTSYILAAKYEGIHTWYITATDNVGHVSDEKLRPNSTKQVHLAVVLLRCQILGVLVIEWYHFTAGDPWSGLSSAMLQRYSYVTGTWSDVQTWTFGGTTGSVSRSYMVKSEGVFY